MGFVVGVAVWAIFVMYLQVTIWADDPDDEERSEFWLWPWLAIPVAGYLIASVATARRSTRRFGQGMLLGLTALLPVAFMAVLAIIDANTQ